MDPLKWVPEAFPKSGGLSAAGFSKLLGRPQLDPLAVLIREAAQNSWDARLDEEESVWFTLEGWDLTASEVSGLRELVFTDAERAVGTGLPEALTSVSLPVFLICDRNTVGLGGPLQAGDESASDVYDWVDFVLNVGKANDAGGTGGTYGFGKTISYVVSTVRTVVIHSRTIEKGHLQTRLIGCAIGDEFTRNKRLHTGRHWWGADVDGAPVPVTGRSADDIARRIGMPEFDDGATGTNLMILAPDLGGRTLEQAMNFLAESAAWNLWPKLISRDGLTPMEIWIACNGNEVKVPDPRARPPLDLFARAFRLLLDDPDEVTGIGEQHDLIECLRPRTEIGDLVTVAGIRRARAEVDDGSDADDADSPGPAALIGKLSHHVALLRTPELVVEYLEGPPAPSGSMEWAGVFLCRPDHDASFAASEPPTHDSWKPDLLPDRTRRSIVNVGLREIRRALEDRWDPAVEEDEEGTLSTGLVASQLADLVRTVDASGPGRPTGSGGAGGGGERGARVRTVSAGPELLDGVPITVVRIAVDPQPGSAGTTLHLACGVALDGASSDADLDPSLRLIRARFNGESVSLDGTEAALELPTPHHTEIEVSIARGHDTSVLLDVQPEAMDG